MEQIPRGRRQELVDSNDASVSIRQQCQLLEVPRSTWYYEIAEVADNEIDVLNEIRGIWARHPFYGYRRITKELCYLGRNVNHKRVQRLMHLGGIQALYPGPNTSRRNKLHAVHPYLLGKITIERPNQAWMVDITYLRFRGSFMYLVAFIDVYSRYVVSWSLSNTLETAFCLEALKWGLSEVTPEIINSDQGSQFTSDDWVNHLKECGIKISMTGKGRCLDNVYIERFWRSFKQEEFYLNEYDSVQALRLAISRYIEFYNKKRWHQSLDYKTPAAVYFAQEREACGYVDASYGPASAQGTCGQVMDNA